jgi:hypothetical protein
MDPVITVSISICMSVLFGVAAVHKLQSLAIFRSALDEYRLIPRSVSGIAAVFVVTAELLAAVLIPGLDCRSCVMAGLLLFTQRASASIFSGQRNDGCSCSSPSRHDFQVVGSSLLWVWCCSPGASKIDR